MSNRAFLCLLMLLAVLSAVSFLHSQTAGPPEDKGKTLAASPDLSGSAIIVLRLAPSTKQR